MNVLVLLVVVLARGGRVVVEATNQTQEERRAVAKRLVESVLRKIGSAENSKIPDGTGYVLSEINGTVYAFSLRLSSHEQHANDATIQGLVGR